MTWENALGTVRAAAEACRECGACTPRCEVLCPPDAPALTVGSLARAFVAAQTPEGVASLAAESPDLVFAVRRCCMDGLCTLSCPDRVNARAVFAALRELLALAGVTTQAGFESTQVDKEWHIFSVYRAVHGIYYNDLPGVADAPAWKADTLFFPGCSLASYAPDLTREVLAWLRDQGMNAVLSVDCCGSPLRSGGFADRANAHRQALVDAALAAGITRVVFVCPGCRDEWEAASGADALELVALPQLLADAGASPLPEKVAQAAGCDDPTLALFDSCHDRDGRFGSPLRRVFADCRTVELAHHGKNAVCCGAAGAVSLVDPAICDRRARRVLDEEPTSAGANLVVSNCPTCEYTFAATRRAEPADAPSGPSHAHYLELLFPSSFDWPQTFSQLESMWTGEYGPWVCQQLL
ncbi:hypothetical protein GMI70_01265 [Eggerthellaceae bacterium zg-893]|nr:hypothetical protein [Eggerthellaceae bacterium zg-893]